MMKFTEYLEALHEGNPLSRDLQDRERGVHKVIMSSDRKHLSPEENAKRRKEFHSELQDKGLTFKKTKGVWKNDAGDIENEDSVVIHAPEPGEKGGKKLLDIAHGLRKKYDQDAFIHRPPAGEGIAHNRDGSTSDYGGRTGYNKSNPYGETQFRPKKPAALRPKMTFTDDPQPARNKGSTRGMK